MLLRQMVNRMPVSTRGRFRRTVADAFHVIYYSQRDHLTWKDTRFLGVPIWKNPLDLWIYQEMLHELRPDLIIETGTAFGGSALYLATLCDTLDRGRVVSIDIKHGKEPPPSHPRITYILGSSTDPKIVADMRDAAAEAETVLVILDSDHSRGHVLDELRAFASIVTAGSYIVVEDTNLNGHPVVPDYGPGPMEGLEAFLAENPDFEIDTRREKFYFTFNPRGYLRRVR
jgi:cephalosporin hydroxylase